VTARNTNSEMIKYCAMLSFARIIKMQFIIIWL